MEAALESLDLEAFKTALPPATTDEDTESNLALTEKLVRSRAMKLVEKNTSIEEIEKYFLFVVDLAKESLCNKSVTVTVMQDFLECLSKNKCAHVFTIIENHIDIWKSPEFFEPCRNLILRTCNDLLKRLSRTIDTQFCGRVNILLARSLPLFEKSGLNITGQFNILNDTGYDREIDESLLKMPDAIPPGNGVDIDMTPEIPVDFKLYQKFWELQKYFSDPSKVYEKTAFETFQQNMSEILGVFNTYRLDKRRGNREFEHISNKMEGIEEYRRPDVFFAKYQTSQKLLHLQFADPQFRRYFFVQVLILCQYLQSEFKFREVTLFLTDDQNKYINEITEKCYKLLRDTFPRGFQFSEFVRKVLSREKVWSAWKNEGCPDWLANRPERQLKSFKKQEIEHYDPTKIDLGNKSLNALWSVSPDNLSACRDIRRNFIPSVEEVMEEAMDHLDPEQGVEEAFNCFNNEVWQWKNSRLFLVEADQYLTTQSCPAGKKTCQPFSEVLKNGVIIVMTSSNNEELKARGLELSKKLEEHRLKLEEDAKRAAEEAEIARKQAEEIAKQKALESAAERKKKEEELAAQRKRELEEMVAKKSNGRNVKEESKNEDRPKSNENGVVNGDVENDEKRRIRDDSLEKKDKRKVEELLAKKDRRSFRDETVETEKSRRSVKDEPADLKMRRSIKEEPIENDKHRRRDDVTENERQSRTPTTPLHRKRDHRSVTPITAVSEDESVPKKSRRREESPSRSTRRNNDNGDRKTRGRIRITPERTKSVRSPERTKSRRSSVTRTFHR